MLMTRLRSILRRAGQALFLAAISVSLMLLLLEVALRLFLPQQLIELRPDIWQPTDGVGWRHRPDADTVINTGDGPARIVTDSRGHRIGPRAAAVEPSLRLLAVGDSFLEAIQVNHAETFVARIESQLSAQRQAPVRVVNTGVGGWGPEQYLIEARSELERKSYDAVLIFVYLPNDRVVKRRKRFSPSQAAERRRLRWPRSLAKREIVDAVAYPINDVLERRSHLFTLVKQRAKFLLMRAGLSAHYFPAVLATEGDAASVEAWRTTAAVLDEIRDLAAAGGAPTLAVLLPGVYQVNAEIGRRYARAVGLEDADYDLEQPNRLLAQALDEVGIVYLDALSALRSARAAGDGPLFGAVDTHLSPRGHQVVADAVLPRLLDLTTLEPYE